MKISKKDLLAPANFVTTAGLIITAYGAIHLDRVDGFFIVIAGKLLDVLDGPVARRTHTSDFGAIMDATADKITGLILLISALYFGLAPLAFLIFLFLQHITVATLGIFAAMRGLRLAVTRLGKNNMFLHLVTLFTFIGSHFTHEPAAEAMRKLGLFMMIASIITGTAVTTDYIRIVRQNTPKHL